MTDNVINKAAFFNKIGYNPHAGQRLYHASDARFKFANCGRRFGKSTMSARDLEPKLFLPNKQFWIVGPTYDLGEKEFRVVWQDLILGQKLGQDKAIKKAYSKKQGNMYIEFPWGTRLEVRSADHPENLVGDALDHVIMSEAAKHNQETWERFIQPALADKRGSADFPTTPEGFNWLYDLWMMGQNPEFKDYDSFRFPSWDNLEIFPGGYDDPEIQLLRRTMRPEAFRQEIAADFGSFSGKIYPDWDSTLNVGKYEYNPAWPNYIAFDWGYTNPLAAIEFQVSPRDEIFVWREHYESYMRVEAHCAALKRRDQPQGYKINLCFGDAADPEATQTVNEKFAPCVSLPEAKENWREGIDLVASFILREEGEDEYGGPIYNRALHVDFSCVNTIKEFNNYKAPDSIKGKNVTEMGIRSADHALDALRYGLVHIFKLGAHRHLSEALDSTPTVNPYEAVDRNSELVGSSSYNSLAGLSGPESGGFFTTGGQF